ncbi:MAG TPA: type II toxin-antitoxin system HicB family antitoxin [Desulfosporosinus sp.]|nr:type II toxin-antitoxin system HicB family antitoxin [Desulfosporosinus sp.]
MKEINFKVILEWDDEAKVYVVTVPSLPGCVTQGANREEALERIQEAIEGHVEALNIIGRPVRNVDVEFAEVRVHVS